jgi:hypothetical protein
MVVSATLQSLPATGSPDASESFHGPAPPVAVTGSASTPENIRSQNVFSAAVGSPDVVKVQMEPPGEIAVYQFVNQQGTLVLQVPPQQLLNLAREISQELAQEAATKSAAIGGVKNHGR